MGATIVVAVDLSPASRAVAVAGAALAADLGATVALVHASPTGSKDASAPAELSALAEEVRQAGAQVRAIEAEGEAAHAILEQARGFLSPFVVVGTAGRSGLRKWRLGSVAQDVVHRSPVPVLVVPGRMLGGARRAARGPRDILVAVDFSADSDAAFTAALRLAKDLRCGVRLVHVVTLAPAPTLPDAHITPEMVARDEQEANAALARLMGKAAEHGVRAAAEVHVGHPASSILAAAQASDAALVVVGTHGSSGLRRLVLGSVADMVVQAADRPVLVVPDPAGRKPGSWLR